DFNIAGMLGDAFHHLIESRTLHIKSRSGAAALAVVEENGAGRTRNGRFEIGVFEDDVGRFATEFKRNFLEIPRGSVDDQFADLGRTGESNLIDPRMRCQRGASGFAISGDDVDYAFGE